MTMTDERTAVAAFLRKCNEYAKASIERKQARGELAEIPRWEAYIEYNQHALEEIANDTLDPWFQPTASHQPPPTINIHKQLNNQQTTTKNQPNNNKKPPPTK